MRIIVAADKSFREMAKFAIKKVEEFGYIPLIYDLGGLGIGKKFEVTRAEIAEKMQGIMLTPFKPRLIADALKGTGGHIIWIDTDAFIIKPIVLTDDFDVGVMMRRQSERGRSSFPDITGYLNAGVIFFKGTEKAREFVREWEKKTLELGSDQHALNELVREVTDLTEYDKIFVRGGVRIKVFRCDEYNYYYLEEGVSDEARILHFKGGRRSYYDKYRQEYL